MSETISNLQQPRIWQVGALCRALADALDARFNPVRVGGEISAFSRATSGHCYFSLKDESGQIRCVMFRRTAVLLDFSPCDGELVELHGRIEVYEPRGDLQLIVESVSRVGSGLLYEQFLRLKSKLDAEGLFDRLGKRPLPVLPRGIGIVTSLGAAALHDVVSVLRRRVPHIPVLLSPASVQGAAAPQELIRALSNLYAMTPTATPFRLDQDNKAGPGQADVAIVIDVILLVRGGGSIEDLWAFNDEQLARSIARSPVPVVCGIGHETDFTIADFVADLRAPTPTAAAELVAQPRVDWLVAMNELARRGRDALVYYMDQQSQVLDIVASRLGRPTAVLGQQRFRLASAAQRLEFASLRFVERARREMQSLHAGLPDSLGRGLNRKKIDLERAELRLGLLDPSLVLRRGYAWLTSDDGQTISSVHQIRPGQTLHATLADGEVDLNTPASS